MNNSKRIEQLWKENSHIPFMQSKEILAYGYNKAVEDFGDGPKKKELKEDTHVEETNKSKVSNQDKMIIEMNLLSDLQLFVVENPDLTTVYDEITKRLDSVRKKLSKSKK